MEYATTAHQDTRDIAPLEPLIRYYADTIARLPWVRLSHDDLMQEGWLAALRARERFDPARGVMLSTYLKHRIKGAMLDAAEAASLRYAREIQVHYLVRSSVPIVAGTWRLASCFSTLPPTQRSVIYWHYIEGWSLREISAALSIHPSRVYQLKAAGIRALRRHLAQAVDHPQ